MNNEGYMFDVDPDYDNRNELRLLLGDFNADEEGEDEEDEEEDKKEGSLIGYWLEGDSLAPPCQADMTVVDAIINFANLNEMSKVKSKISIHIMIGLFAYFSRIFSPPASL